MNQEKARQILTTWLESSKGIKEQLGYIEGWFNKEDEKAFLMAIEALKSEQTKEEWIFNPKDAIDLMFTLPKCNKCGFESADCRNFCPNCGTKMVQKNINV